ncbi:hypothetical protein RFI_19502 [Reticulomyxa filosa]|uniref:Uncharacterized protein n=1 Tax=Reticulomyxa filosa TaxID=46433 RepID=X6MVC9_RETFI|nr:hypothetical protein RFI_19502 [Reticulomyxa filosa]|eukprot:ETO17809.1 hypothetical protein RFI_19502 [Reticulomyxa filosa]
MICIYDMKKIVSIEKCKSNISLFEKLIRLCNIGTIRIEVILGDVISWLSNDKDVKKLKTNNNTSTPLYFDLIIFDHNREDYFQTLLYLLKHQLLHKDGVIVANGIGAHGTLYGNCSDYAKFVMKCHLFQNQMVYDFHDGLQDYDLDLYGSLLVSTVIQ